jgi:predicted aspartyl protease
METELMGKVLVAATLDNLADVIAVHEGRLSPEKVRRVEVTDALVDTGAYGLLAPSSIIARLGLEPLRQRTGRTIGGPVVVATYRAVRLTIQGRDCITDVGEIPDEYPVIVGQIPLEMMDWVVDPRGGRLIGNPEHGGEDVVDVFQLSFVGDE